MDRYLVLENGKVFKGKAFGADGDVYAEVVFTTAMTGFFETLTDNSYCGQAVVHTFPLIGNYGVIHEDAEGDTVGPCAYIVRQWCDAPSNFRCEEDLDTFLKSRNIVGLYGIDTRALTRILRENGVMNGFITSDLNNVDMNKLTTYRVNKPVEKVSCKSAYKFELNEICDNESAPFKVALMDFGMKKNIARLLVENGCEVTVFPQDTSAEEILAFNPDGIFLSNGPGDPEDNIEVIDTIKALLPAHIPTMGICLGHQLLALAHGFKTKKLKYGHRGANQPVKNLSTGRVFISSQNHGYAVVNESIDAAVATPSFINVNDGTNEGMKYLNAPIVTVQFHPEACGGPKDTEFLFSEFIDMMKMKNSDKEAQQ